MKSRILKFLQKNDTVKEKDLEDKNLEELMLLKDKEHDFLSINIPILVAIWIASLPVKDSWHRLITLLYYLAWAAFSFYVIEVNEISKKNMKVYNKVITKKLREQKNENDEYKKEIAEYLKEIKENLKK